MNRNKKLSIFSTILAIISSDLMSARVAIEYCNNLNLIKYEGSKTSASVAFSVAIPYIIIILCTLFNSYRLWVKPYPVKK